MKLFDSMRRRRVVPWIGAYVAGGFLILEGLDQLVGHSILPELAYHIGLVFYLFGIPATMVLAWFHGEKGTQKPPAVEVWIQSGVLLGALVVSGLVTRNYVLAARAVPDYASSFGLDPNSVAVLYFEDLSAGQELDYLADGLTESLIDRLSRVRALDIVSRNGAALYRDTELAPDSVARVLGVGTLISGTVEQSGTRLHVNTRLVDGASGANFERSSFELPASDLFAARDSVAEQVTRLLRRRLGEEIQTRERRFETRNVDAWAMVQRGERLRKQAEGTLDEDFDAGLQLLQAADSVLTIAAISDTAWAEPHVLRAELGFRRARVSAGDPRAADGIIDLGLASAASALEIEPGNPAAIAARGKLKYLRWLLGVTPGADEASRLIDEAQNDLEAAVDADASLADALNVLSHLYYQREDLNQVLFTARRAYEEDAYLRTADAILWRLFGASYDLQEHAQAEQWCDELGRRFPDDYRVAQCRLEVMTMPEATADIDLAWAAAAALESEAPGPEQAYYRQVGQIWAGAAITRAGLLDSARNVLDRARADRRDDPQGQLAFQEAFARLLLGERDEALDLLSEYVASNPALEHDPSSAVHWWWFDLRDDPRFMRMMRAAH